MAQLEVLRIGSKGTAVTDWQFFLTGQHLYHSEVDGDFGLQTKLATISFQELHHLQPDGLVGNKTFGVAMLLGFGVAVDTLDDRRSEAFPPTPDFNPILTDAEKRRIFGNFSFVHDPQPDDPEHIRVTGGWAKDNLMAVPISQLKRVNGDDKILFHHLAAGQLQKLWADWETAGLLHLVLTWAGSYNPRFIRGSRKTLSNHAFGTAFDINVAWNNLGAVPALVGQKGSVRELVPIANDNGFYWGGHFTRKDGMHFEVAKLTSSVV